MYAQPVNRIQILPTVGLIALILVTAGFSALMVVFGGPILTALFAIACLGLFFALSPNLLLWAVILGSLIFVGVSQLYYPPLSLIRWLIPFATAALFSSPADKIYIIPPNKNAALDKGKPIA